MTTLAEILGNTLSLPDWAHQEFSGFGLDSRQIQQGQIFIALHGLNNDLANTETFVQQALAQGAIGVLTEFADLVATNVLYVANLRQQLGHWQKQFLQRQQEHVLARCVAVTGTNGKTTVSRLIAELLTLLGQRSAVMGTTGNGILPQLQASTHTTLDALQFQTAYYHYSQQGAQFLALEASSHGLEQGRIAGTAIEVAAYTNLSRDHLDYHHTMEKYAAAKARLFDFSSLKHVVLNADDPFSGLMQQHAQNNPAHPTISCYSSLDTPADYAISELKFSLQGADFRLHTPVDVYAVHSPLLGRFNVDNLLAALICVEKLGFDLPTLLPLIPQLQGAPGRMQSIHAHDRLFIVDYAHTPDALLQVLQSLRHHVVGKLRVLFGCGGDRDRGKRPLMTQVALDHADQVILTADNPRSENVQQILADMQQGINLDGYDVIEIQDRRAAICYAVEHAQSGDIVVIAGKGHENYQEINNVKHWFDDVVEVQSALAIQQ